MILFIITRKIIDKVHALHYNQIIMVQTLKKEKDIVELFMENVTNEEIEKSLLWLSYKEWKLNNDSKTGASFKEFEACAYSM